jgi:hypothetical protein
MDSLHKDHQMDSPSLTPDLNNYFLTVTLTVTMTVTVTVTVTFVLYRQTSGRLW